MDIVTQPGIGPIRGQTFYHLRDGSMTGKSPFVTSKGPERLQEMGINVGGTVHSYQLKIAGGKCELVKGAAGPARVTLTLQAPDFLRLVTGTLNGMQAFMTGKLKLTGDMMFAQVMQGWFEQ